MTNDLQTALRALPSVDSVMNLPAAETLVGLHGRGRVVAAIRTSVDALRSGVLAGEALSAEAITGEAMLATAEQRLIADRTPRLKRVVNATGIVLHTGLGRAVMPPAVAESLASLTGCCNIQMDLETGDRVKREHGIRDLVCELTGAEDALLVNNNAAATLLVLKALAEGKEVVVSRGELIEIGGSFRLPDIMSQSGAKLREVGATNKTHARDYAAAICSETALLLKVHKSNYEIVGFSKEVSISEIAKLGREHQVPVVDDLGCGALVDLECFGLEHEMTVAESLDAGADLALFSTDKLIGGPQGGLIVGRADLLDRIRKHPLYRAFRVGKMTLAALEATLRIFRAPDLLPQQHPVYTMLAKTLGQIEAQATRVAETIAATHPTWDLSVEKTSARLGGGALPSSELPSFAVQITTPSHSADELALLLRRAEVPVIPRIQKTTLLLDMRTVSNADIEDVVAACGTIKE